MPKTISLGRTDVQQKKLQYSADFDASTREWRGEGWYVSTAPLERTAPRNEIKIFTVRTLPLILKQNTE